MRESGWRSLSKASLWMGVMILLLASVACGDDDKENDGTSGDPNNPSNPNNNTPDVGEEDLPEPDLADVNPDVPDMDMTEDEEDEPTVMCEPNTVVRCLIENTPEIELCNFRGNQIVQARCEGTAVCREGECVEVACIPGTRLCASEDQPVVCTEDGSEYVNEEACGEGVTCSAGRCLDLCELAEQSNSYIGCEYWPVELENYLLIEEDDEGDTSTPDAPFAVVLANPQQEPAKVTVFTPEGGVLDAIPEVYIPVGLVDPRFMSTTVFTQVTDVTGTPQEPLEGELRDVVIPPGGQLQVLFPRQQPLPYATTIDKLAWHVVSDRPVVAYQFNPICCNYSFTNDASILLPKGALTKEYYAMTFPSWRPRTSFLSPATLTIVATEDETEVEVHLGSDRVLFQAIGDDRLDNQPEDDGIMRITMQAQEVLNLEASETLGIDEPVREVDLTGAYVKANKDIAVFGGHSCTNIPFSQAACDHLEQQLFPLETWGRNYTVAPLKLRGEGNGTREATYWKILAQEDGTSVVLDRAFDELRPLPQSGPQAAVPNCRSKLTQDNTISLNAGEYCEFGTRIGFSFDASNPVLVGAFMSGQFSTENEEFGDQAGDPAFFLVPPSEQFRTEYDFLTPPTYALDFVTVTITRGAVLTLDGEDIDPMEYDPEIIESRNAVRAHIPLGDGPHKIRSTVPFGIVVYAYDDYVSYAYTGGLDLKKLNVRE